jgi:hypothetical protein
VSADPDEVLDVTIGTCLTVGFAPADTVVVSGTA